MRNYSFSATRLSAGQHAPHMRVGTVQQFCEQKAADSSALVRRLAAWLALEERWDETRPPNVTMAQYLPIRTGTFLHLGLSLLIRQWGRGRKS
jgi:hypothetical protein